MLTNKTITAAANKGFASVGVTCILGTLCFDKSFVRLKVFCTEIPIERQARESFQPFVSIQMCNLASLLPRQHHTCLGS
jgi:hypothetical protein